MSAFAKTEGAYSGRIMSRFGAGLLLVMAYCNTLVPLCAPGNTFLTGTDWYANTQGQIEIVMLLSLHIRWL